MAGDTLVFHFLRFLQMGGFFTHSVSYPRFGFALACLARGVSTSLLTVCWLSLGRKNFLNRRLSSIKFIWLEAFLE